jgi:hypothetical protein
MDPNSVTPDQTAVVDSVPSDLEHVDDRVHGANLFHRVYASTLTHRLVPTPAALGLATLRAKARERVNPAELTGTRAFFAWVAASYAPSG